MKRIVSIMLITVMLLSVFSISIINSGAVPAEVKGKTVCEVLGMSKSKYISWLESHENDKYYKTTPYGDGDYRNPKGDCSGAYGASDWNGHAAMNCTGFVWHVLYKATQQSGGRTSIIPALGRQKWLNFYRNNQQITRKYFSSKSAMLNSGYLSKGDIIWMYVNGDEYTPMDEHHIGIYWGDGQSDVMWHSSDETGTNEKSNVITRIIPKLDYNTMYMVLKVGTDPVVKVVKTSSNPTATNNNSNYSFAGIRYMFSTSRTDFDTNGSHYFGYVELDENGEASSLNGSREALRKIKPGTYYVKEFIPSAIVNTCGYKLNETVYTVTVSAGNSKENPAIVNVTEDPYLPVLKIEKSSTKPSLTDDNENYTFNNIKYCVYTSADNWTTGSSNPNYVGYISLDANGVGYSTDGSNNRIRNLGYGTYYVKEYDDSNRQASGYKLNEKSYRVKLNKNNSSSDNPFILKVNEEPDGIVGAKIIKRSASPELTDNNDNYSLEGAVFNVYRNTNDAAANLNPVVTGVTTDENGIGYIDEIAPGEYVVREMVAPKGYKLSDTYVQLIVDADSENICESDVVYEEPQTDPVKVLLRKRNATTGETTGTALSNAEYTFKYYAGTYTTEEELAYVSPERTWVFRTDDKGEVTYDDLHLVSGDALFPDGNFPLGTVTVKETKAPTTPIPFYLDDTLYIIQIKENEDKTINSYNIPVSDEYEIPRTTIHGTKTWVDNNNANGNRPNEITINLIKTVNGTESIAATTTTSAAQGWEYEFSGLLVSEFINGLPHLVSYRAEEVPVANYTTSYSGNDIINTEKQTTVKVSKVWNDNDDQDGMRPQSVTIRLYSNGSYTGLFTTLSESNNWTYTFRNLPIKKNGIDVSYTVVEDPIAISDGTYRSSVSDISGNAEDGFSLTVTNTHTPIKTSATVKKKWTDMDDVEELRPTSIRVLLRGFVDGRPVYTSSYAKLDYVKSATDDKNVWSYTFTDLDKYYEGQLIEYVATEMQLINGYNLDENGEPQRASVVLTMQEDGSYAGIIENVHELSKTGLDVTKVWDDDNNRDGFRPDSVTVYLATVDGNGNKTRYTDKDGNEVSGVLQESNNWTWRFTGIPIYDSNKQVINYSVEEVVPAKYTVSYSGNNTDGITITNTHHEITSVTVNKIWDDNNNQDGIRPSSVTVNLFADGTRINRVRLYAGNNWTYTFSNLPVSSNGSRIKYTVTENAISVPAAFSGNGYTAYYSPLIGSSSSGYTINVTNKHEPLVRSLNVAKVWSDNNDQDGIRPEQVEVTLYVSSPSNTGFGNKKAFLSAENNWSCAFNDLPKYYNGSLIQYAVDETDIPIRGSAIGYVKSITGNMDNGFTITNTYVHETLKVVLDKVWDDDENLNHTRPASAEFNITGYQGQVTNVILNESNNWHYECTYDKYYNGELQSPVVEEVHLAEGYVSRQSVSKTDAGTMTTYEYTVTNSYEPEPTEIPVNKTWVDGDNGEGIRAESVDINLYRLKNGEQTPVIVGSVHLSEDNGWQDSFTGLFPRYVDGVECEYYIQEDAVNFIDVQDSLSYNDPQDAIITGNVHDGYNVTNTHKNYRNCDMPVKKQWDDDNNADGLRPDSIQVALVGYIGEYWFDGNTDDMTEVSRRYATITASDDWEYTFEDLPAFFDDYELIHADPNDFSIYWAYGNSCEIFYKIYELSVPVGYEQTLVDDDDYIIYGTGEIIPARSGAFEDQEEWKVVLSAFGYNARYDSHESYVEWRKTASPTQVAHSNFEYLDVLGLVNEHTSSKTRVTVNKIWDDNDNRDGVRPASLTVNLMANNVKISEATLNDRNNWTYTFSGLYANENGTPINYTVTESAFTTPDGFDDYVLSDTDISGNADDGWVYTLTNSYEPETTEVTVNKRWQDSNNIFGTRPDKLLIVLKADGVAVQTHTMTVSDATTPIGTVDVWTYTFSDLPKYSNGVAIDYTAEEQLSDAESLLYKNTRSSVSTAGNGSKTYTLINRNKTAAITIVKNNQNGVSISGSEFELYFLDGTPMKLNQLNPGRFQYQPNATTYTNTVSSSTGSIQITNLPTNAVLVAREVTAPSGYSAYPEDIHIDIRSIIEENELTDSSTGVYTLPTVTVNNYKTIMPATGGGGEYAFYVLAGLSLIGSIIFLFKKRKDEKV